MRTELLNFLAVACLLGSAMECFAQKLSWGQDAEGFRLAVGFEKTDFQKDGPVDATIIVRNTSDRARHLASGIPVHVNYGFFITRDGNEPAAPIPQSPM